MALHKEDKKMVEKIVKTPNGFWAAIMFEFLESDMEAASVDIPENKTAQQTAAALRSVISHDPDQYGGISVAYRNDKVYLLKK